MDKPLDDKTRILLSLIRDLYFMQNGVLKMRGYEPETFVEHYSTWDTHYTHFAGYREVQRGDLVLCLTSGLHDFTVGWAVQPLGTGDWRIRELGSERTCDVGNERFVPIVGLNKLILLEGAQRAFYDKVQKAFARGDAYGYRFGGLDFDGDAAIIWIREAFGGVNGDSVPFSVRLPWSPKTPIKAILAAMRDGGYGTRPFDQAPPPAEPTEGEGEL